MASPSDAPVQPTRVLAFTGGVSATAQRDILQRVEALARIRLQTDSVRVRGR